MLIVLEGLRLKMADHVQSEEERNLFTGVFEDQWEDPKDKRPELAIQRDNSDTYLRVPESRIMVLPKHKLAFCYIEKNACTEFNVLFNEINSKENVEISKTGGPWQRSGAPGFGLKLNELTRRNGWKWAAFFRDPVVRYTSAFQSKCIQEEASACEPRDAVVKEKNNLEEILSKFQYSVKRNSQSQMAKKNPHYGNQIDFCGGVNSLDFDFMGLLEGNVHEQVAYMLEMAGVDGASDFAERYFSKFGIKGHQSSIDQRKLYQNNSALMDTVNSMYSSDVAYVNHIRESSFSKIKHVMEFH